jgi:hypothetical protein
VGCPAGSRCPKGRIYSPQNPVKGLCFGSPIFRPQSLPDRAGGQPDRRWWCWLRRRGFHRPYHLPAGLYRWEPLGLCGLRCKDPWGLSSPVVYSPVGLLTSVRPSSSNSSRVCIPIIRSLSFVLAKKLAALYMNIISGMVNHLDPGFLFQPSACTIAQVTQGPVIFFSVLFG